MRQNTKIKTLINKIKKDRRIDYDDIWENGLICEIAMAKEIIHEGTLTIEFDRLTDTITIRNYINTNLRSRTTYKNQYLDAGKSKREQQKTVLKLSKYLYWISGYAMEFRQWQEFKELRKKTVKLLTNDLILNSVEFFNLGRFGDFICENLAKKIVLSGDKE